MGKEEKKDKDHKKGKKDQKVYESRDEKMLRRLEKKKRKREAEVQRKTICGYTDENNRFGDSNLTQEFRWHKKEEMLRRELGSSHKSLDELSERERRRAEAERKAKIEEEVEKVKKRRDEREKELAWMEEEKARMLRESEQQQHEEWERKADDFHLEQAMEYGNAKPTISILNRCLATVRCDDESFAAAGANML